jgi:hypothetical protein
MGRSNCGPTMMHRAFGVLLTSPALLFSVPLSPNPLRLPGRCHRGGQRHWPPTPATATSKAQARGGLAGLLGLIGLVGLKRRSDHDGTVARTTPGPTPRAPDNEGLSTSGRVDATGVVRTQSVEHSFSSLDQCIGDSDD